MLMTVQRHIGRVLIRPRLVGAFALVVLGVLQPTGVASGESPQKASTTVDQCPGPSATELAVRYARAANLLGGAIKTAVPDAFPSFRWEKPDRLVAFGGQKVLGRFNYPNRPARQ